MFFRLVVAVEMHYAECIDNSKSGAVVVTTGTNSISSIACKKAFVNDNYLPRNPLQICQNCWQSAFPKAVERSREKYRAPS